MKSFKLKVTLDPAKHAVPHEVAQKDPKGYTCGCVVSQAVNDALGSVMARRFRRWKMAWADTGIIDTQLHVGYAGINPVRKYEARLPKAFYQARLTYDENRGKPVAEQAPIVGCTRTLTFKTT